MPVRGTSRSRISSRTSSARCCWNRCKRGAERERSKVWHGITLDLAQHASRHGRGSRSLRRALSSPLCARISALGISGGTWRGSTGERPGSARWNQTLGLDRTVGIRRRPVLLWDPGPADQPAVRSAHQYGWSAASSPSSSPPRAASTGGERIYPAERAHRLSSGTAIYPVPDLGSRVSSAPARQTIPKTTVRR